MHVKELLENAVYQNAADIFIVAGLPASYRIGGVITQTNDEKLMPSHTSQLVKEIYELASNRDMTQLLTKGDDDFSFAITGLSRFRVSAYKQRGTLSAVIRIITFSLPSPEDLGIPQSIIQTGMLSKGLVLVTGPAGSGKSTTLACIIDYINKNKHQHIITLEDPLEYLHRHDQCIVSQREIAVDTEDYLAALRACLRQAPDVILLGEMRDAETIRTAITAAETGHTVIATLHTNGAVNAIDRIVDSFSSSHQSQIRVMLSMVLQTVVSQQLLPNVNGDRVPAFEIMHINSAIRGMIRDNKNHQIGNAIAAGRNEGMITMDQSILNLYKAGVITRDTALDHAENLEQMKRQIG